MPGGGRKAAKEPLWTWRRLFTRTEETEAGAQKQREPVNAGCGSYSFFYRKGRI